MDRELLVKLLRNDLTEEEARLVKEWLDLSEQNRQYYAAFQLMWEKKKKLPVDVERNYTELFHKRKNVKRNIYAWHWRAAVIVLLLGTSLYISKYYINRQAEQERPVAGLETEAVLHTGDKETFVICKKEERQLIRHEGMIIERRIKTLNYNVLQDSLTQKSELHVLEVPHGGEFLVELEDGSKIWVNAESNLEYLVPFAGKERRVKLSGEAYFQVAKADIPFIVEFNAYEIKVLGSEFNVKAYFDEKSVVTLAEGKVEVETNDCKNRLTLKPNEQVSYSGSSGLALEKNINTNTVKLWMKGEGAFIQCRLDHIVRDLERKFDVKIVITDHSLSSEVFTCRFKDTATIEQVLHLLKETRRLDYLFEGEQIRIFKPLK